MYWHPRIYKQAQTIARGATSKFDIPVNVPIGTILLKLSADKNNVYQLAHAKWRMIDWIDDIALVADGKTIIKSLPATLYQVMNYYDQGGFPPSQLKGYTTHSDRVFLLMNFGRFYHDKEMYLPAGLFDSLELQINFAGTSTQFDGDGGLDIILEQPAGDGVPASKGYLKSEVWREWTTVADEWKYFTLPTGYRYRRIFLQALTALGSDERDGTNLFNLMDEIKLAYKNGDVEVYHDGLEYLAKMDVIRQGGWMKTMGNVMHTADKGFYTGLGYVVALVLGAGSNDGAVVTAVPTVIAEDNNGAQAYEGTEDENAFVAYGCCPEYCTPLHIDEDPDPAAYLDAKALGDIMLDIHTRNLSSAAGGTARLIFDRLVT